MGGVNDTFLAGATAVQLERTKLNDSVVYITTNGSQAKPVGGVVVPGNAMSTETRPSNSSKICWGCA